MDPTHEEAATPGQVAEAVDRLLAHRLMVVLD